jgi:WD40 repeat protein
MVNRRSVVKRRKSKNKTKRINQRGGLPEVTLLDTLYGDEIRMSDMDAVTSLAFHSTLPFLAISKFNGSTSLWLRRCKSSQPMTKIATLNRSTSLGHSSYVQSVAFHPTDNILATGSNDNTVKIWRISPLSQSRVNRFTSCFRPGRPSRAGEGNWKVRCVSTLEHSHSVTSVAFHNKLPLLATGSYGNIVRLWMLSIDSNSAIHVSEQLMINKSMSVGDVHTVAFHPTAPLLAGGGSGGIIKLWSISSNVNDDSPEVSSKCTTLSCFRNSRVQSIWTASEVARLDNEHAFKCLAFHPTEPIFATGSNIFGIINLWRLSDNKSSATHVATINGHIHHVNSILFPTAEPIMITCSSDETVKLWLLSSNLTSAKSISTINMKDGRLLQGVTSIAYNPKLLILATGSNDGTVKLWDCEPSIKLIQRMLRKMSFLQNSFGLTKVLVKGLTTKPTQDSVHLARNIPGTLLRKLKSSIADNELGHMFSRGQYRRLNAILELSSHPNRKMLIEDAIRDPDQKKPERDNDSSTLLDSGNE